MVTKSKFVGARLEPDVHLMIDDVAKEEHVDKTVAIKILIKGGWKEYKMQKALEQYKNGEISIDKAAQYAKVTVHEMMQTAAAHGIRSTETVAELRAGLKHLMG